MTNAEKPAEVFEAEDRLTAFEQANEQMLGPGWDEVLAEREALAEAVRRLYEKHNVDEFDRLAHI